MRRATLAATLVATLALSGSGGQDRHGRPTMREAAVTGHRAALAAYPPVPGRGSITAWVVRPTWLLTAPEGRRLARLPARSEFGSPRVLLVVGRRGPWIGVLAPELRNGQVGWLEAHQVKQLFRQPYSLQAVLSRRLLIVRWLDRRVATFRIAIGRSGTPTPTGHFAVTDKLLSGSPYGPYGCCVLALTGHQPRVSQGWGGGDRLAIHATAATETIGHAVSHGCLRTTNAVMRRLVRQIPIGTPLLINR